MQVCPTCLYLVEGGGQANYCSTNWGNGFATNAAIVKDNDISDATPFFEAVLQKPWLSQVTTAPVLHNVGVLSCGKVLHWLHTAMARGLLLAHDSSMASP